jgi:phage/plasmid-like protein (TIGR03299 family)
MRRLLQAAHFLSQRKENIMSDNLLIQNGQASMFYVNEVPWHRQGTKLDHPATAQEAITAAQLDWKVVKLPLFAGSKRIPVTDRFAVVRRTGELIQKTDPVLGVVSNEYTPLQNRQAFQFFDPIVGQNAAVYHTAGALGNGERVWILAKLPGHIRVVGDDITEKYLLLSNSHDGKSSVTIKFTPVRVVCQNTLTLALNEGSAWRVSHHADIHQKLRQAHQMLGLIHDRFAGMEQTFQAMSRVQLDSQRLGEYLAAVYPDQAEPEKQSLVQRDRHWSEFFFDQGRGNRLAGVAGSLWAGFNGITEWIDHHKTRQNPNQRLNSAWFGESARIKVRAYTVAMDKMAIWN